LARAKSSRRYERLTRWSGQLYIRPITPGEPSTSPTIPPIICQRRSKSTSTGRSKIAPLAYDGNANLLSDGTNTYSWEARNQLASIAGPLRAGFTYDSFGRRTSLTINGGTTQYLLLKGDTVGQEISPTGAHLISGLGTSRTDPATGLNATFVTDDSGDTIALTDDTGTIQTDYSYGPFGAVSPTGAPSTNPYQLSGTENDGTGLYYASSGGYYSPTLGLGVGGGVVGAGGSGSLAVLSSSGGSNATIGGNGKCMCDVKLQGNKVKRAWDQGIRAMHAFWNINNGQETIGGHPEPTYSFIPGKTSYLDVNFNDPDDNPFTAEDPYLFGDCSSDTCKKIKCMEDFARNWQSHNGTIMYGIDGPNSNTAANLIGQAGSYQLGQPSSIVAGGTYYGWGYPVGLTPPACSGLQSAF
jgi:hypothetical protein